MKFTNFQRKTVSLIVLATFVVLLHFSATPAPAATSAGNSETAIAQGDNGGPSFVEVESIPEPVIKKAKKFPWLLVGLGVVAVGVAVYFLVILKPKYTLTVTLGPGCTGIPPTTSKYKKGTVVNYNYTPLAGYSDPQVKLDGVAVLSTGTVTMDKDKALTVTAEPLCTLTVTLGPGCTGTPAATTKYNKGTVVTYNYSASAAGYFAQVNLDGANVADSGTVTMDRDHALTVTAEPFSIAGSWSLNEVYTNGANYTATFTFIETVAGASGTYRSSDGDYGTWTKNLMNVRIESDYYSYMVYTGSFTAKNKMSGTCLAQFSSGLVNGTWTATKTSSSASHTPAATQSGPKKQIKNN